MEAVRSDLARASCSVVLMLTVALTANAAQAQNIHQATLGESNQRTSEVSTEELRRILAERTATVLDARPFLEYAISHIPGARNVAPRPMNPDNARYVAEAVAREALHNVTYFAGTPNEARAAVAQ